MRNYTVILAVFIILTAFSPEKKNEKSLRISDNGKYIEFPDGRPFLWIGDTAWELFHKLNKDEAVEYLENRKEKGFSVIQAVVLAENDGLRSPNAYGALPLHDLDPEKPNEEYFRHIDFIVNKAEELGLFVAILPAWGDKVYSKNPGAGPVVFNKENAFIFGEYLGKRYGKKPVIWILGGDRNVDSFEVFDIWKAMAMGLKSGDMGRNLISFHPRGATSSSMWFHNEDWLDFNMYQSGHESAFNDVTRYASNDALLQPRKPFVDGEPAYEDIAIRFWEFMDFSKPSRERVPKGVLNEDGIIIDKTHFSKGFISDKTIRVQACWNFLSGACGYTYGNNAIWQMFKKGDPIAIPCLSDWRTAMDRPGAEDLKHIRKLFEARSFHMIIPDQSIVYGPNNRGRREQVISGIASDGSFALVYLSVGQDVLINMNKLDNKIRAGWFDTREGSFRIIGEFENTGIIKFSPPTSGDGEDWMLILDDKTKKNVKL